MTAMTIHWREKGDRVSVISLLAAADHSEYAKYRLPYFANLKRRSPGGSRLKIVGPVRQKEYTESPTPWSRIPDKP